MGRVGLRTHSPRAQIFPDGVEDYEAGVLGAPEKRHGHTGVLLKLHVDTHSSLPVSHLNVPPHSVWHTLTPHLDPTSSPPLHPRPGSDLVPSPQFRSKEARV